MITADYPDGTQSAWVEADGWTATGTIYIYPDDTDNSCSTTITISGDSFDNHDPIGPSEVAKLPPIEPPERPKSPPPRVQVVLDPPKRRMALCRPRVVRPRPRQGGIGTRNWHCR